MKNDLMVIGESVKMELKQTAVVMPENYIFGNALKAADLILRQTVDRQKRPALDVCSKESVHTAILDMAVQGLNPLKDQCYFIVYGNKLNLQTSYMGKIAIAKRVVPEIADIRAVCIYEGDTFELDIVNGNRLIKNHKQTFESLEKDTIKGAYAVAVDVRDKILFSDIMTMDQIKQAWKQSTNKGIVLESGGIARDSTHGKFGEEMVKKTIYGRICKKIIKTSNDEALINSSLKTDEETPTAQLVQREIAENANQKLIDFPSQEAPVPIPEEQSGQSGQAMATTSQARTIVQLEKNSKRDKDATLHSLSVFTGRPISRLGELTADEAANYIDAINTEMLEQESEPEQNEKPKWA
jgi:recombination protein RecT